MYRCLVQKGLAQTASDSVVTVRHAFGKRAGAGRTYFTMFRKAIRGQAGITYSRWQYLKKAVCTNEQIRDYLSSYCQMQAAPLSGRSLITPEGVDGVFEKYHILLEQGRFKPEFFIEFISALFQSVYADLEWLPWLQKNNQTIAFIQILMNERSQDLLTGPLYGQKHFQSIYNHISENVSEIPPKNCPSILSSLLYSGLKHGDPLVLRLLSVCYTALPDFQIGQIRDLASVLQIYDRRHFILAGKLVSRLQEILCDRPEDVQIYDLAMASTVLSQFMSAELWEKCISAMLLKVQESGPDLDIFTIGYCFRWASKLKHSRAGLEKLAKIIELGKMTLDRFTAFDRLQSYEMAQISHYTKSVGCYSGNVAKQLQERSLELLQDRSSNLDICDVTNLLSSVSNDAPLPSSVKKNICQLLKKHLADADVMTLANIAQDMMKLHIYDPDLMTLFQQKVLQNINNIAQYITRFVKIMQLLAIRQEHDAAFNQQLGEILLALLKQRHGFDVNFVVNVACFVLPNVQDTVPAVLMERLVKVIPRCHPPHILHILKGLENMKGAMSRSLHNQVLDIRCLVQHHVGRMIENATCASHLANLVKSMRIKPDSRNLVQLEHIMSHFPRLTKTMTCGDFFSTTSIFKLLQRPYYHPQVFEDLIVFAKNNYAQIGIPGVLDLVIILADSGYSPADFEDFSNFVVQVMEDAMKESNFFNQIGLAYYLSILQSFHDDILGQIFTFEYLEKLDSFIEVSGPSLQNSLSRLMMQLNRTVILECPQLDVPWFNEQYCQKQAEEHGIRDVHRDQAFMDDVEVALQEVMKGDAFFQHSVHSPYFIPIDFQIVLDAAGEPVASDTVKQIKPDTPGYQRLALKLISSQELCTNSHRRSGRYLQNRRHLEMLGYKVEEIPRYEWNSMVLSEWSAKVKFVQSKVYPRVNQDQKDSSSEHSSAMHPYWK